MKKMFIALIFLSSFIAAKEGDSRLNDLFGPFLTLNKLAKNKDLKLEFSPLIAKKDLINFYGQLSPKYREDKKTLTELTEAYTKALGLLTSSPEVKFIMDEGTYILGQIPEKVSLPPFHAGLIKTKNNDPQKGQLVCFGPQHYNQNGISTKIRGGQASDHCRKAQADESSYGCREVSAATLYENNQICSQMCWQGGKDKKAANCALPD